MNWIKKGIEFRPVKRLRERLPTQLRQLPRNDNGDTGHTIFGVLWSIWCRRSFSCLT